MAHFSAYHCFRFLRTIVTILCALTYHFLRTRVFCLQTYHGCHIPPKRSIPRYLPTLPAQAVAL